MARAARAPRWSMPTGSCARSAHPAGRWRRRSSIVSAMRCGETTGTVDRPMLGRLVFADPAALADLEAIVHPAVRPLIRAAIEDATAAGAPAVVIEAIKLVEAGYAADCDEVWIVTCDPAEQRGRLRGARAGDRRTSISGSLPRRASSSASGRPRRASWTRAAIGPPPRRPSRGCGARSSPDNEEPASQPAGAGREAGRRAGSAALRRQRQWSVGSIPTPSG